jgi:Sulfotransferase family
VVIHSNRTIFVHIQKTGGTAVATALGQNPNCPEKHYIARDLYVLYGPAVWNTYFKFGFVRNPWDRLVSWWSMINALRPAFLAGVSLNKFQRFVLERATTFEEFLEHCDQEIIDVDGRKWIYRNQLDHLTDSAGRLIVDFIGRFETLDKDFDFVARKVLGAPILLPHVNKSQHNNYSDYFTPILARKVGRRFERDISAFGYVFGR